jgi:hypothetical protein
MGVEINIPYHLELNIIIPTFATQIKKNMNAIAQEILSEKMRSNPDPLYIRTLQRLQDKGEITEKDFVSTVRIIEHKDFAGDQFFFLGKKDCTHIMKYIGGFQIEITEEGYFYLSIYQEGIGLTKIETKNIELLESILWSYYAKNKFN